jgi:hypothetical protein
MTVAPQPWRSIPSDGPIAQVLGQRRDWLDAIAAGSPAAKRQALDDLADDGRTEDRIRQSYTGRAAIELLQNAHDAMAEDGGTGRVEFVLTPTALVVANEGVPFDDGRVRSITRLGSSVKVRGSQRHHLIGYKGIGFTSVFEVSDRPQILSRYVGFKFDRLAATQLVRDRLGDGLDGPVPARYFPLPIGDGELDGDEALVERLMASGAATVVRLPLRDGVALDAVVTNLRETITSGTLLFMPVIHSLNVTLPSGETAGWTRHIGSRSGGGRLVHLDAVDGGRESWLVATGRIPVGHQLVKALDDPLWTGVKHLSVGAAIPWSARGPRADMEPSRLHSYFPTDEQLGRAVVLHGDFYLDASRRRLELKGAGGEVTRAAADGVAALAAGLVESVASWGSNVLKACAPMTRPDEAGQLLGERLEAALADRSIARRTNGTAAPPKETVRLSLELGATRERELVAVLHPSNDILDPADDHGEVRALLERLGARRLEPVGIAARLDLSRSELSYSASLALAGDWLATTGYLRSDLGRRLGSRRVVQDDGGNWTTPARVERRADGAPLLPPALRRPQVREPHGERAMAFIDLLPIPRLDARTALERLLDALGAKTFGRTDEERDQALDLAFQVWLMDAEVVRALGTRTGAIEVPVRTSRARVARSWARADTTYFGADWLDDRTLEQLYAPLGRAEFLAEPPPDRGNGRRRRRAFLEALGVAASPRRILLDGASLPHYYTWRYQGNRDAWECENGHPSSGRYITGWVMDRLDSVLERVDDPDTAAALARGLVMLGEPYGPAVTVACTNSGHSGRAMRKPVVGYQRWRLEQVPWVPVANDPGGAELQLPARAWRGVPRSSARWLQVPRCRLRPDDAEVLGLVNAEKPMPAQVEGALEALATAHPDLASAPVEVRDTADWLLRRLERVLVRDVGSRPAVPLPTSTPGGPRWSQAAVVANVPGLPRIEGVDLLPPGQWPGLQRVYGLSSARDVATPLTETGRRVGQVEPLLSTTYRVHLLALLLRKGADPERTSSRLAGLSERPVTWMRVSWRVGADIISTPDARFVIVAKADKLGRVTRGELIWDPAEPPDKMELARGVAEHIGLPEEDAEIALFLASPRRLVEQRGITSGELEDADRLLRSRRWFVDSTGTAGVDEAVAEEQEDERLDPAHWQPPTNAPALPARPIAKDKEYVQPETVTFGTATRLEAPAGEPTSAPDRRKPRKGSGQRLDRPLAAPSQTEAAATASGRRTEETAIAIVARFGRGLPDVVEVFDVQDDDLGWDLEFLMRDGTRVPVEVKGSSGSGPFVITSNELRAAKARSGYVLYHVVDLTTPAKTRMRVFRNLGTRLTDEVVTAAGWAVTGWRALEPDEITVNPQ